MKLTITNTAQNPTMIFLADKSTRDLAPGQTLKDIEVEDGQAGAYANQPGLDVVGYKKPASADGRKTDHKQADAVTTERAETAEARVTELEGQLADKQAVIDKQTTDLEEAQQVIRDLGEEPTAEDDADDLRKQAIGLGIRVDKRWSDETVQRKIDEALKA